MCLEIHCINLLNGVFESFDPFQKYHLYFFIDISYTHLYTFPIPMQSLIKFLILIICVDPLW